MVNKATITKYVFLYFQQCLTVMECNTYCAYRDTIVIYTFKLYFSRSTMLRKLFQVNYIFILETLVYLN